MVSHVSQNISSILNSWLQKKEIPKEHATARLIFIYKQEQDLINGNAIDTFRPISITSILFKLFEIILSRRIKILRNNGTIKRLNPHQIGF
jgi:hypothetical protein